jgi:hypothetical protein
MTLPPIDSWQVRGVAGPEYKVGPHCCVPLCRRLAEHAHHLWRRSALGGPFSWVELPDGHVVGNLVGMCPSHHDAVTGRIGGHTAAIRMTHPDCVFWWCTIPEESSGIEYEFVAPIEPQPPAHEALVASPADVESENACPTCGRPRARPRRQTTASGKRRARRTWPVQVPADAEENGAEVLDSLTEDLAPLLGVDPDDNGRYTSGRYYVLVPALYFAQTNRDEFVKSILGVG